jgi:MSHA biogenesis protein MshN
MAVSVINKMLRDLDNRQAAETPSPGTRAFASGTASLGEVGGSLQGLPARRRRFGLMAALAGFALAALLWWYFGTGAGTVRPLLVAGVNTTVAAASAPAPAASASVPAEISAPVATQPVPEPAAARVPNAKPQPALQLTMSSFLSPIHAKPEQVLGVVSAVPPKAPTEPDAKQKMAAIEVPQTRPNGAAAEVKPGVPRQMAAMEAMAQAQSLWNSGSREAAIDLMREAVAVAERSMVAGGAQVLVPLVRELSRMELAEGRVSQVYEMLTRLEAALSGQADLWAVRANAAQRLGRHQESATAYLMALKLRPNEPRWMLGAAVSLAVQGQTSAAAELAEKARASGGALSPELLTYLRQLGVPLRSQ